MSRDILRPKKPMACYSMESSLKAFHVYAALSVEGGQITHWILSARQFCWKEGIEEGKGLVKLPRLMIVEILVPKVHHTEDLGGVNVKPEEGPLISFHYSFVKCLSGRARVFFSSPSRGVIRGLLNIWRHLPSVWYWWHHWLNPQRLMLWAYISKEGSMVPFFNSSEA